MVVMPELLTFTLAGIGCATSRALGDWLILARINGTCCVPVIQVVVPEDIIVPAGDGVRGGATPRLNVDVILVTFVGGVGARIGNVVVPRGTLMFVAATGPLGAKVLNVGDRVTIEACVNVRDGKAVNCVRPDASTGILESQKVKKRTNKKSNSNFSSYPVLSSFVA